MLVCNSNFFLIFSKLKGLLLATLALFPRLPFFPFASLELSAAVLLKMKS